MTPLRRIILQFSHSFLTDALTFINLFGLRFYNNAAFRQIVRRQFQIHFVSRDEAKTAGFGFAGGKGQKPVTILQLNPIGLIGHGLQDYTFNFEGFRSGHVRISGSFSVMSTVCSK